MFVFSNLINSTGEDNLNMDMISLVKVDTLTDL